MAFAQVPIHTLSRHEDNGTLVVLVANETDVANCDPALFEEVLSSYVKSKGHVIIGGVILPKYNKPDGQVVIQLKRGNLADFVWVIGQVIGYEWASLLTFYHAGVLRLFFRNSENKATGLLEFNVHESNYDIVQENLDLVNNVRKLSDS
jgi:hypothetical protein